MKSPLPTVLLCLLSAVSLPLQAQQPSAGAPTVAAPAPPPVLISDWRLDGIDAQEAAMARRSLTTAHAALVRAAGGTQSLTDAAAAAGVAATINMRRISDRIQTANTPTLPVPVVIEPVWCNIADQHVIFVSLARADNNELLASAHAALPRPETAGSLRAGRDPFSAVLPDLFTQALAAARAKDTGAKKDALHVGLSPVVHHGRSDGGSSLCLNLLVEESLAPSFTVARSVGADTLASVRTLYRTNLDTAKMRRPTRLFTMQWQDIDERKAPRRLPLTLKLKAGVAESVFAHSTARRIDGNAEITVAGGRLNLKLPPDFARHLSEERASLQLADWPQVTKIYGAWVYLDRGRAWGLKMNDRLVATVNGETVKGHVVRFYGPEQKLTSPRGFSVEEGAIIFIRKGQKLPTTGLEFRFDERQFPTTWPITSGQ